MPLTFNLTPSTQAAVDLLEQGNYLEGIYRIYRNKLSAHSDAIRLFDEIHLVVPAEQFNEQSLLRLEESSQTLDDRFKCALCYSTLKNPRLDKKVENMLIELAEQGHVEAQHYLGELYQIGRAGFDLPSLDQRIEIAIKYFSAAIEAGHAASAEALGAFSSKDCRYPSGFTILYYSIAIMLHKDTQDVNRCKEVIKRKATLYPFLCEYALARTAIHKGLSNEIIKTFNELDDPHYHYLFLEEDLKYLVDKEKYWDMFLKKMNVFARRYITVVLADLILKAIQIRLDEGMDIEPYLALFNNNYMLQHTSPDMLQKHYQKLLPIGSSLPLPNTANNEKPLSVLAQEGNIAEFQDRALRLRDDRKQFYSDSIILAIRDALIAKKYDVAKFFILHGRAYANENPPIGVRPLMYYAVRTGELAIVKLFVENGIEFKKENVGIRTAVIEGHTNIVEYLLEQGADPSGIIGQGSLTYLFISYAALKGNFPMVDVLSRYGALKALEDVVSCVKANLPDMQGNSIQALKVLMDYATGYDFPSHEEPPLISGISGLSFLAGVDISDINFVGVSVNGKPITRQLLQEAGALKSDKAIVTLADLEQCPDIARKSQLKQRLDRQVATKGFLVHEGIINLVPLWRAAAMGDVNLFNMRLAAGSDPNESAPYYEGIHPEETAAPIIQAAKNGHKAIVDILLNHPKLDLAKAIKDAKKVGLKSLTAKLLKLDVNYIDETGCSRFHHVVFDGDIEEVSRLLTRGANIHLEGKLGSPLEIAVIKTNKHYFDTDSNPYIQIIKILLGHGAKSSNKELARAIDAGNIEVVALLLPTIEKKSIANDVADGEEHTPWFFDVIFNTSRWLRRNPVNLISILKLLKDADIDLCASNSEGNTLSERGFQWLMVYFKGLDEQNIQQAMEQLNFLLEIGVTATLENKRYDEIKTKEGKSLLYFAAKTGSLAVVRCLIANGAKVDELLQAPDFNSFTTQIKEELSKSVCVMAQPLEAPSISIFKTTPEPREVQTINGEPIETAIPRPVSMNNSSPPW